MEGEITLILRQVERGDPAAREHLLALVMQELRTRARALMDRQAPGHTLQPTALIHEAYLRLVDQRLPEFESRAHFFGVASRLMRQILVDHARSRVAAKRGAGGVKISLDDAPEPASEDNAVGLLALDEALSRLAEFDERKSRIVEMRSFGGMSVEDVAVALGVSEPTIKRETRLAQAWLKRELGMAQ